MTAAAGHMTRDRETGPLRNTIKIGPSMVQRMEGHARARTGQHRVVYDDMG